MNDSPSKSHRLSLFGAVLAAGLASACCLGPLLVLILGFGSASAFIAMEPYRPIFAMITLSLLVWAGWRYWQGKQQCTASGCPTKQPVLLWLLGGFAILLLISPSWLAYFIVSGE